MCAFIALGAMMSVTMGSAAPTGAAAMDEPPRVTGVGGLFFKAEDPRALGAWYAEHLGIAPSPQGPVVFQWRDMEAPGRVAYTVWGPFKATTTYFDPSDKPFMFNYRVNDLRGLLATLKVAGVTIVGEVQEAEYGAFGWIMDPEGNKIELWEPADDWALQMTMAPAEQDVRAALAKYYEVFSARDWEAYAARFHPGAVLATVWTPPGKEERELMAISPAQFIEQADQGPGSPGSQPIFEETMISAHVMVQGDLATAWVNYDAKFGTEENQKQWSGVDSFTLLNFQGHWKIISLAYAADR
jgi:predicted enzyme related to lactoylglutathione lyase